MFSNSIGKFFKTDAAGRLIFFPDGRFGKGYVIKTNEQEARARKFLSAQYYMIIPLFAIGFVIRFFALLLWPVCMILFCILKKKLVSDMEPSTMKFSRWDKYE